MKTFIIYCIIFLLPLKGIGQITPYIYYQSNELTMIDEYKEVTIADSTDFKLYPDSLVISFKNVGFRFTYHKINDSLFESQDNGWRFTFKDVIKKRKRYISIRDVNKGTEVLYHINYRIEKEEKQGFNQWGRRRK